MVLDDNWYGAVFRTNGKNINYSNLLLYLLRDILTWNIKT